jgi:hypothetical protein
MGELSTVFSEDTRAYIYEKARCLHGEKRREFIAEAEREVWDFGLFDRNDVQAIIRRVLRRYLDDGE